jgi:hypothetical protein
LQASKHDFIHFQRGKVAKSGKRYCIYPDEFATKRISALGAHLRIPVSKPLWESALLLVGAIPAPGKRTVTAILRLLVEIPWAQRVWALPFFTVLAPSDFRK